MNCNPSICQKLALAILLSCGPLSSKAQVAETAAFDVTVNVGVATDIRARGVSQTYRKPGASLDLLVLHDSGLYARGRLSNVSKLQYPGGDGANVQLTGGFRWSFYDDFRFDVRVVADAFPGAKYTVVKTLDLVVDPDTGEVLDAVPTYKSNRINTSLFEIEASYGWATFTYSRTLSRNFYGIDSQVVCSEFSATIDALYTCLQDPLQRTRGSGYMELELRHRFARVWNVHLNLGHQTVRHLSFLNFSNYALGVDRQVAGFTVGVRVEEALPRTAGTLDVTDDRDGRVRNTGKRALILSVNKEF